MLDRKSSIHCKSVPLTPYDLTLEINLACETLSKSFAGQGKQHTYGAQIPIQKSSPP